MSKKPLSRKKELEQLREQVKLLKKKVGERPTPIKDGETRLSEEELEKLSVIKLRRMVVDNKLFTGISRMKKAELIRDIMKTDYYKSRSLARPTTKRPTVKGELAKVREEKKLLEKQLKEAKEVRKPVEVKKDDDMPPLEDDTDDEDIELLDVPKIGEIPPAPPIILPAITPAKETIKKAEETEKIKEIDDVENVPEKIGTENKDIQEVEKEQDDASGKYKEGLVSHHSPAKKSVDVGNTIINMYCGGSSHPDFPVPQSVVRHALKSQQLPLREQQQLGQQLRQTSVPQFQGIPREVIPEAVPHRSHKDIRARFDKPAKKFKPVKTTKPIKKIDKPSEEQLKEVRDVVEPDDDEWEDDDDEIEETAFEKSKRLQREELAKVAKKGKRQKGKKDAVRAKLEGIFSQRLGKKE